MSQFKINAVKKKGGRLGHDLEINGSIQIDFKFNTKSVTSYPQLIDLKSSELGNLCYAKFYYNYSNIKAISQKDYLNLIWQYNAYKENSFFFNLKHVYKTNLSMKNKIKENSFNSIKLYIKVVILDIIKLNQIISNINKIYLLYYKGDWIIDKSMLEHKIILQREIGRNHNAIFYSTNKKSVLRVALYWKNNTGVLVPFWKLKFIKKIPKKIVFS